MLLGQKGTGKVSQLFVPGLTGSSTLIFVQVGICY